MSDITFEYVTDPGDSITFELTGTVTLPPGGGGGTSDHRDLTNRSSADQHPTSAVTGLDAALAGKETAGAAATAQAYAVQRANHTGTQSADSLTDGTANKAYTAAEQSKLAAITGTNTGDQTLPTLSSLGAVPTSRTLAGLDLSADRTASALRTALGLVIGTDVAAQSSLAAKADLASPALTGNPTAPTQSAGDNSSKVATTAYVDGRGKYRTVLSAGGTGSTIAGVPGGSIIGNLANTNSIYPSNFLIYEWFICPFDLDITALYARTYMGGASSNTRIGLVEGTKSFQPTGSMLTESSSVATTANETLVTHTPGTPIRLTAGRVYATTIQFDGTAPTWYCLLNTNGPAHQGGWSWAFGPDRAIYALRVSRSYGAVSGTPPAWNTVSNTSNLVWNRSVLMTWTEA